MQTSGLSATVYLCPMYGRTSIGKGKFGILTK